MSTTVKKVSRIGYTPTKMESTKILYISKVFCINMCDVLRIVLEGHWTLDELHYFAQKVTLKDIICPFSHLGKVFDPNKNIETILEEGTKLFYEEIFGIGKAAEMMSKHSNRINESDGYIKKS